MSDENQIVAPSDALNGMTPQEALQNKLAKIDKFVKEISLTLDGVPVTLDSTAQVSYDSNQLNKALSEQPGRVAWWGSLVAKLARLVGGQRAEVERIRAQVATDARNGVIPVAGGKITVDAVQETATLDARVRQAEDVLLEMQEKLDAAKAVCEALRHRKDVMVVDGNLQIAEIRCTNMKVSN
jgi:hypothetical protein